eukprot:c7872_g1_i1.p1 GENE.c7872_g1_i1~~c7872_g1_i1.p1  ORF type:complete len:219 (-),score=96.87 c7872_g1_i1:53-709(-)
MQKFFGSSQNQKTFRPKKKHPEGKRVELHNQAQATLGAGDLRDAVKLPAGEDLNEWLAMSTVDFFNEVSLLYGTVTDFCTDPKCPVMCAGAKYEYLWADGKDYKTPVKVSAPKYVDLLMSWVQTQLDDEAIFPSKVGVPFPKNFDKVVKNIFKRLFRVYAHIYHSHFDEIASFGAEAHLNTCFKHFVYFVQEFGLVEKSELAPMEALIESISGGQQKQ